MSEIATQQDRADYKRYNEIVATGRNAFLEVATALENIRTRKLYRIDGYKSFDDFCKEQHSFSASRAHKLIAEGKAAKSVDHGPQIPNSRQARELAKVPEEKRQEVWNKATEDGKPTAAKVKEVAEKVAVRTDGKISGGNTFNVDEIESASKPKPPKNGRPTVATKDRAEALELSKKLIRKLDLLGIGEKWAGPMSEVMEDIKRA